MSLRSTIRLCYHIDIICLLSLLNFFHLYIALILLTDPSRSCLTEVLLCNYDLLYTPLCTPTLNKDWDPFGVGMEKLDWKPTNDWESEPTSYLTQAQQTENIEEMSELFSEIIIPGFAAEADVITIDRKDIEAPASTPFAPKSGNGDNSINGTVFFPSGEGLDDAQMDKYLDAIFALAANTNITGVGFTHANAPAQTMQNLVERDAAADATEQVSAFSLTLSTPVDSSNFTCSNIVAQMNGKPLSAKFCDLDKFIAEKLKMFQQAEDETLGKRELKPFSPSKAKGSPTRVTLPATPAADTGPRKAAGRKVTPAKVTPSKPTSAPNKPKQVNAKKVGPKRKQAPPEAAELPWCQRTAAPHGTEIVRGVGIPLEWCLPGTAGIEKLAQGMARHRLSDVTFRNTTVTKPAEL